jgi:hypothetical protein
MSEYNNNSKKYGSQYSEDDQLMINLIDQGLSETGRTFIHCTFTSQPEFVDGGWLNIFPTTYLVNRETSKKLQMEFALDIPVAPKCHFFRRVNEQIRFTLIFPKLPADWQTFTLIEESERENPLVKFDIKRNKFGVYQVIVN